MPGPGLGEVVSLGRETGLEEGGDAEDEAGNGTESLWTSHLTAQASRARFFLCLAQPIVPWAGWWDEASYCQGEAGSS